MNKARSIKQNARPDALPNFRNLGVTLRILLICNGLAVLEALLLANAWGEVPLHLIQIAALLSPVLLTTLLMLWAAQPWLARLPYLKGVLAVNTLAVMLTLITYYYGGDLYHPIGRDSSYFDAARYVLLSIVVCAVLLMYFRWRSQVLSHALHDARLHVLRARIRPHFLFNTINAVLSIVRAQPKQAETALEDMSDLFRMAMAEPQDLVPLRQEILLGRQYIALEQLRMGERLQVEWQVDAQDDALIPPLLLQPLLENAVYHGIESLPEGGSIRVELRHSGDELLIKVENPCAVREAVLHTGNRMALQNIRERLELMFDVEARYHVEHGKDFYRVEISLPYVREGTA
ncbi:alginate O-acetyltransferase [Ferrigenium kumadai]|uniref:Alginate O-acetyltransferase n=1 Tax=Ferrigenium kumadai TaxID=1682490 RepID=A0AAN1SXH2_9PROT|nr:histidine kinase [Ferrigenium kumadai]BBI98592.1 alginate O-acetyltransferase [Ferrigenium kumadai]